MGVITVRSQYLLLDSEMNVEKVFKLTNRMIIAIVTVSQIQ